MKWVSIGSGNGLLAPSRTNTDFLSIRPLGRNFSEIRIKVWNFSCMEIHMKMSSTKWRPFCPGETSVKLHFFKLSHALLSVSEAFIINISYLNKIHVPNGIGLLMYWSGCYQGKRNRLKNLRIFFVATINCIRCYSSANTSWLCVKFMYTESVCSAVHKWMNMYDIKIYFAWGPMANMGLDFHRRAQLGKSSGTFSCTCQIFKLIFLDCYKYLAYVNALSLMQFIQFFNFSVNSLRLSGH